MINRYFVKRLIRSYILSKNVELQAVDENICFFGYYNISPNNSKGDVLYLKVNQEKIRGSLHEPAMIMLKKRNGEIRHLCHTLSWNWQQGCMLQWLHRSADQILFNDYDENMDRYISKVINTNGELIKTYDIPVNNISKSKKFALSLNYCRLAKMRPAYGYFNKKDSVLPSDKEDGIWHLDLITGKSNLIISLEQLKHLSYSFTMEYAEHKVNHIDINPSGTRFMFLHRWLGPHGRFTRLVTANILGLDIYILNGDNMTSHSCWLSDDLILSFCEYNGKQDYFQFKDRTDEINCFASNIPKIDGHPSVSINGKLIITDTYPDNARFSSLYIFQKDNYNLRKLGRFYQPLRYKNEKRIDLHPKWSFDSKSVFFESGHSGQRQLYELRINI